MASSPQTAPDTSQPATSASQQHEASLLRALEISPYELTYLERHLSKYGWIQKTTDEAAIKDAVFKFRESFFATDCYKFNDRVDRLNNLFDAFPGDDEEAFSPTDDMYCEEAFERRLNRETAKYNAVRSLIADLAMRESRKRENGGQAS